jgi:hypothetical protein
VTTIDFPLSAWKTVRREWFGQAYYDEFMAVEEQHELVVTATPANRLPDREGGFGVDPDDDTKRWEWDTDLDAGEQAVWDAMMSRLAGGDDSAPMPSAAAIDAFQGTMKAFRDRSGTATNAQRDAAIDALIDGYRYLRRLGLGEE